MIRSFRYRIYPTKRQAELLNTQLSICAELYNAALTERRDAWKFRGKSISYFDQTNQVAEIRKIRPDVAAVNTDALQGALRRVDLAFKAFYRRIKAGEKPGYPRFRSATRYDSFMIRRAGQCISSGKLRVSRVGLIKIKITRPIEGTIKTLTVKRECGRWYGVITCEIDPSPLAFSPRAIGIDVGLTSLATLSDGTVIENPRWYRNSERRLRVAQRRVARRRKGSNRRRKAITILQRGHAVIKNQRGDFLHKLSTRLVRENGLIAVENLNVKGLARTRLAKSIHDAAWSTFIFMLTYKAESAGRVLVKVDPRGTSQTCTCGATVRKTLAQRWHLCLNCGLSANRDHVSAQIVLSRAHSEPSGVNVDALMSCVA